MLQGNTHLVGSTDYDNFDDFPSFSFLKVHHWSWCLNAWRKKKRSLSQPRSSYHFIRNMGLRQTPQSAKLKMWNILKGYYYHRHYVIIIPNKKPSVFLWYHPKLRQCSNFHSYIRNCVTGGYLKSTCDLVVISLRYLLIPPSFFFSSCHWLVKEIRSIVQQSNLLDLE